MTSLDQIVLPLAESRALVEKGIVLDTALVWGTDVWGFVQPLPSVVPENRAVAICPAPTLGELLDAIYARYDNAEITMYGSGLIDEWIGKEAHQQNEDTDLLAAYKLLLEVAK